MLSLLIKMYFLRLFSGIRHGSTTRILLMLSMSLIWLLFLFYIFRVSYDFFTDVIRIEEMGSQLANAILALLLFGITVILFFSGVTISLHFYYVSSDLSLLLGVPIEHKTVFEYKFFEIYTANSTLFWYAGLPVLLAYGAASHSGWSYYPFALLLALFLIVVPVTAAILFILPLARYISPGRAREISGLVLAIIIVMVWAGLQFFRVSIFNPSSATFDPYQVGNFFQATHSYYFQLLPSSWIANILHAITQSSWSDALRLMAILVFFAYLLASVTIRLMLASYQQDLAGGEYITTIWRRKPAHELKTRSARPNRSLILTIFQRDVRLILRDTRQLSQFIMLIVMMIVMPLVMNRDYPEELQSQSYLPYFYFLFFVVLSALLTGSKLIPLEGKGFWHIIASPLSKIRYLLAKFLVGYIAISISSTIALLILCYLQKSSIAFIVNLWLATLANCMGASSLAQVVGVTLPKFDWENPKRMLASGSGLVLMLITLFYSLFSVVGSGIIFKVLSSTYQNTLLPNIGMLIYTIILALLVTVVSLNYAVQRLNKFEWHF